MSNKSENDMDNLPTLVVVGKVFIQLETPVCMCNTNKTICIIPSAQTWKQYGVTADAVISAGLKISARLNKCRACGVNRVIFSRR